MLFIIHYFEKIIKNICREYHNYSIFKFSLSCLSFKKYLPNDYILNCLPNSYIYIYIYIYILITLYIYYHIYYIINKITRIRMI